VGHMRRRHGTALGGIHGGPGMFEILVGAALGVRIAATASCDLVEINHCHGADGEHQFTQLIAWDYSPEYGRFDAQAWLMVESFDRLPMSVVVSTRDGQRSCVRCKYFRETWTRHDPERENAKLFNPSMRRKVF